jgi:hypothetical protein
MKNIVVAFQLKILRKKTLKLSLEEAVKAHRVVRR